MSVEIEADLPDITAPWTTLRLLRSGPAATGVTGSEVGLEPGTESVPDGSDAAPDAAPEAPADEASEQAATGDDSA